MFEGSLRYGGAPDGSVVDWNVDMQRFEVAESMQLIMYHQEDDIEQT